jgi:hypothetical protein
MKLDNEQQRAILLQLLHASQFPGSALDEVICLRDALRHAEIKSPSVPKMVNLQLEGAKDEG